MTSFVVKVLRRGRGRSKWSCRPLLISGWTPMVSDVLIILITAVFGY